MSRKIAAVLIDLSGTIHIDDLVIPGAVDALKRLRSTNLKIKFVTNTTKESKRILHERLTKIGFEIDKQEIFTSLTAAHQLLSSRNLRPLMLVANAAHEEFNDINKENPNAVLVGLAPDDFHYEKLTEAFRLLMEGATLVAIHKARYYMRKDGLALGPGAFVTGLEYSTGCKSEVVGKPEAKFFHSALEDLECKPEEAIMIGDDARDDVAGAQAAGLLGILVKTGKYQSNDETKINPSPEYVADSFTQAVDYIIEKYL